MSHWTSLLIDLVLAVFNIFAYTQMTQLKNESRRSYTLMYGGCCIIILAYCIFTYLLGWPSAKSTALFLTFPSLLLFWSLSKYKDARFFLTFCMIDTVTFVPAFLARIAEALLGEIAGQICLILFLFLLAAAVAVAKPLFRRYRLLLEQVHHGWTAMMVSSAIIYAYLLFFAVYPAPLAERPEYIPVYLLFFAIMLSTYAVFIGFAQQTARLYKQSRLLQEAQKWHQTAYVDALTGCLNRMAYIEKINHLERTRTPASLVGVLVFDLDDFKNINDTLGHSLGDIALKNTAELLSSVFKEGGTVFRIGGDEFAVITEGLSEASIQAKISTLEKKSAEDSRCHFSGGYSLVNHQDNNAVEQAFIRADRMMYEKKRIKKRDFTAK